MKRTFISILGICVVAATAIYLVTREKSPQAPVRIGVLYPSKVFNKTFEGLKAGMRELGYVDGQNVEYLSDGPTGGKERLKTAAAGLIEAKVDLIFASSTPAALMAYNLSKNSDIPIVFAPVNDPVKAGIVDSIRTPGGRITGIRMPVSEGKRLLWLTEIVPGIQQVLMPMIQDDNSGRATLKQVNAVAPKIGVKIVPHELKGAADVDLLLAELPAGTEAIFLPRTAVLAAKAGEFSAVAIAHKLPMSAPGVSQVKSGALYSYGVDQFELGLDAADYVHKIIIGQSPATIPVETASPRLFINTTTAKAIGIQVPDQILKQARRVFN